MIIRIVSPSNCPCYDHDGFCEAVPSFNLSCGGDDAKDIPVDCPARKGLVIIITEGLGKEVT